MNLLLRSARRTRASECNHVHPGVAGVMVERGPTQVVFDAFRNDVPRREVIGGVLFTGPGETGVSGSC